MRQETTFPPSASGERCFLPKTRKSVMRCFFHPVAENACVEEDRRRGSGAGDGALKTPGLIRASQYFLKTS